MEESIRERFRKKGYGVNSYARAKGLNQTILSLVLAEKLTGERNGGTGMVRKTISNLKRDGVWIGSLPWEGLQCG